MSNRKLHSFASGLLATCLVTAHLAGGDPLGDPVAGQRLFVEKGCVRCHAVRGAGGRIGPDLGRKAEGGSFYEIAALMWNHSQGMAGKIREYRMARPVFEENELTDLVSFLYFLNYFDEPGDPRTGRFLFREKHCIRCHEAGGEGGAAGPPLDLVPRGTSPLRLASALWNHGPAMMSAIEEAGLAVPKFQGSEIIDLFAFIRSVGERRSGRRFQSPGDPEAGLQVFQTKKCSSCHEIFGDGGGVGPDLGRMELRGSVTQIAGRMWNHWPDMARTMEEAGLSLPEFGEDELLDLFAYIYAARYRGVEGDSARGRAVYERKGCAVCHGPRGEGSLGPGLEGLTIGRAPEEVFREMWNHAPAMDAHLADQLLARERLTALELADLLAFLTAGWTEER